MMSIIVLICCSSLTLEKCCKTKRYSVKSSISDVVVYEQLNDGFFDYLIYSHISFRIWKTWCIIVVDLRIE